jgi:hypothetical protein
LDDADRERLNVRRGAYNKLGFGLQLTTVRFLGTFLAEPTAVPSNVVAYAAQLGIRDVACLADYAARPTTAWEHAAEIRRGYGYRDFNDPGASFRLVRWLYQRAWLSTEPPSVLFDLATAWLVERQVLLPGVTVLERLVTRIRERANTRLYRTLAGLPSKKQRDRLGHLLVVPAGSRRSPLDQLQQGPTQPTATELIDALQRLRAALELGVGDLDMSRLPPGRLKLLARSASTVRAQAIQRMPPDRGMATLVAFACTLQARAQDDVLDVLDRLLTDLLARVDRQEQRRRLRTIGDLDVACRLECPARDLASKAGRAVQHCHRAQGGICGSDGVHHAGEIGRGRRRHNHYVREPRPAQAIGCAAVVPHRHLQSPRRCRRRAAPVRSEDHIRCAF